MDEPSPLQKQLKLMLPKHLQTMQEDTRAAGPELVLGGAAIKDCADAMVLDRLLMYERRIENSLHKTIRELDRRKLMRQIELQNAQNTPAEYERTDHPHPFGMRLPHEQDNVKREEVAALEGTNLKKQSQFIKTQDTRQKTQDQNYLHRMPYGKDRSRKAEEKNAKQSQFKPSFTTQKIPSAGPGANHGD